MILYEWIDIRDKQPDDRVEVLVWMIGNSIPIQAYFNKHDGMWKGSFEVRDSMNDGYVNDATLQYQSGITHWMPLPNQPKTP